MAKIYRFTLPEVIKQRTTVINDRYGFVDGVLEANEAEGKLIERILVPYHGCTLEVIEPNGDTAVDSVDTSLAKTSTLKSAVVSTTPASAQVLDAAESAAVQEKLQAAETAAARVVGTGEPEEGAE